MNDFEKLCHTAVKYAGSFNKIFDYSDKSIDELDKILNIYHIQMKAEKVHDDEIMSAAVIFGAYVGQTLLNNGFAEKGYNIKNSGGDKFILENAENGNIVNPVAKVFSHLKNGAKDSIKAYYDAVFLSN